MTEQININVITSTLRQKSQQLQEANRASQLSKERRQRVEAEAKRQRKPVEDAKPWPGAVPEGGIKEELAAYRGGYQVGVAYIYLQRTGDRPAVPSIPSPLYTWTVVAPNNAGTVSFADTGPADAVILNFEFAGGPNSFWSHSLVGYDALPAGGENIVLLTYVYGRCNRAYLDPLTSAITLEEDVLAPLAMRAAIVGPSGAREIPVPSLLESKYAASIPPYFDYVAGSGFPRFRPNNINGTDWNLPLQCSATGYGLEPGTLAHTGPGYTQKWSGPAALSLLTATTPPTGSNAGATFLTVTPNNIRAFLTAEGVALPPGTVSSCRVASTCGIDYDSFDFARSSITDALPAIPDESYRKFPNRKYYAPSGGPVTDNKYVAVVWDWGRPAFCRQKLLSLGFTSADLVP